MRMPWETPMYGLVFDIGGTNLRCARVDLTDGSLGERLRAPVDDLIGSHGEQQRTLKDVVAACMKLAWKLEAGHPTAVGVGFPGPVGMGDLVLAAPTLGIAVPSLPEAASFTDELRRAFPEAHVVVLNDLVGAGFNFVRQGFDDFHIVTISSGVGQKLFVRGQPVLGPAGWGGELGHVAARPDAPQLPCDCGKGTHIGAVASGRGIERHFAEVFGEGAPGRLVPDARVMTVLRSCPEDGSGALADCLRSLSYGLAIMRMGTGISKVVLTGGACSGYGEPIRSIVARQIMEFSWDNELIGDVDVVVSRQCDDDVLIGLGYVIANPDAILR